MISFKALTVEKRIGQMMVITRKKMTVKFVDPNVSTASGTRAKVGKLCKTSNTGNAKCEYFPVANISASDQASKTATKYAHRRRKIEVEKSINKLSTVNDVNWATINKNIIGAIINDNVARKCTLVL